MHIQSVSKMLSENQTAADCESCSIFQLMKEGGRFCLLVTDGAEHVCSKWRLHRRKYVVYVVMSPAAT